MLFTVPLLVAGEGWVVRVAFDRTGSSENGRKCMSATKVKDVLTTGEVAKICNVAPRTVSKWFDSGALHGYRIPAARIAEFPSISSSVS